MKEQLELIRKLTIDKVVSDFVKLEKRGDNYIGLCPFHKEKTPSFTLSPEKGIYKCFGCGKAGTMVDFIMEMKDFSRRDAIDYLLYKYIYKTNENI